ncbi:uncharacterized protein METZ01_LOCUS484774 [marine metagenome]|uniref:Uncharacterized protein n=1 Tax=marine metagenome TaxID=408172 RepID=A0A383CIN0_9ZZZZ
MTSKASFEEVLRSCYQGGSHLQQTKSRVVVVKSTWDCASAVEKASGVLVWNGL